MSSYDEIIKFIAQLCVWGSERQSKVTLPVMTCVTDAVQMAGNIEY